MRRLILATALAALGACASADRAQAPAFELAGTSWEAIEIASLSQVRGEALPTLEFISDTRVRGNAGCNPYGAQFNAFGERLEIDGLVTGSNNCRQDLVTQQNTLLRILSDAWSYRVDGGDLVIQSHDRRFVRFRRI